MIRTLFSFFSSLKLTFVLLCAAAVLVFAGTLAQVHLGLYSTQNQFFRSLVVWWHVPGTGWRIPVFPGGYTIGVLMLINLAVAHFRYYRAGHRKLGVALIHAGIVLLLLGQFLADLLQVETRLRLTEGQAKSYSENNRIAELAVMDTTDPATNRVVALPASWLARRQNMAVPEFPLTLRVLEHVENAQPVLAVAESNTVPVQGIGRQLRFKPQPGATSPDAPTIPAALLEVTGDGVLLGRWWVSTWLTDERLASMLGREAGAELRQALARPQDFTHAGRRYELALRPRRHYKPFAVELIDFRHDKYPGTDIPKNFSSRVRIRHPGTEENREVLIYMNHPLRYAGETYYQADFDPQDPRVTVLQVVRNPGWLTPYVACVLVSLGMALQFLTRLVPFVGTWRRA
ncbi:MAG: cytochrome c biogenesis protein ResB [Verrucomicrobia bacterium]|nr:cytochrome c biogenesis protein ResB [Verrucomicrobiota bacterium]